MIVAPHDKDVDITDDDRLTPRERDIDESENPLERTPSSISLFATETERQREIDSAVERLVDLERRKWRLLLTERERGSDVWDALRDRIAALQSEVDALAFREVDVLQSAREREDPTCQFESEKERECERQSKKESEKATAVDKDRESDTLREQDAEREREEPAEDAKSSQHSLTASVHNEERESHKQDESKRESLKNTESVTAQKKENDSIQEREREEEEEKTTPGRVRENVRERVPLPFARGERNRERDGDVLPLEFCVVEGDWAALAAQTLPTHAVPSQISWRFPREVDESVSNTSHVQQQNFFFPSGVRVELLSHAAAEVRSRMYNVKRHIVPFTNKQGTPLFACCLTLSMSSSPTQFLQRETLRERERQQEHNRSLGLPDTEEDQDCFRKARFLLSRLVRASHWACAARKIQRTFRRHTQRQRERVWREAASWPPAPQRPQTAVTQPVPDTQSTVSQHSAGSDALSPQRVSLFQRVFGARSAASSSRINNIPPNPTPSVVIGKEVSVLIVEDTTSVVVGEESSHSLSVSLSERDATVMQLFPNNDNLHENTEESVQLPEKDAITEGGSTKTAYSVDSLPSVSSSFSSPSPSLSSRTQEDEEQQEQDEEEIESHTLTHTQRERETHRESKSERETEEEEAREREREEEALYVRDKCVVEQRVLCVVIPVPEYTFAFSVLDAIAEAELSFLRETETHTHSERELSLSRSLCLSQVERFVSLSLIPRAHITPIQSLSDNFSLSRSLSHAARGGTHNRVWSRVVERERLSHAHTTPSHNHTPPSLTQRTQQQTVRERDSLTHSHSESESESESVYSWSDDFDSEHPNTEKKHNHTLPATPNHVNNKEHLRRGVCEANTSSPSIHSCESELSEGDVCVLDAPEYLTHSPLTISLSSCLSTSLWSLAVFSAHINTKTSLKLLNLLLLEKSVVVVGYHSGVVTAVIHALRELLTPYVWEGLCVPLVPDNARALFEAPVPFIVGTLGMPKLEDLKEDTAILQLGDNSALVTFTPEHSPTQTTPPHTHNAVTQSPPLTQPLVTTHSASPTQPSHTTLTPNSTPTQPSYTTHNTPTQPTPSTQLPHTTPCSPSPSLSLSPRTSPGVRWAVKEVQLVSWFVRLPAVPADLPAQNDLLLSTRVSLTRRAITHFLTDKFHLAIDPLHQLPVRLQDIDSKDFVVSKGPYAIQRNVRVHNTVDRVLMSHLPENVLCQLQLLHTALKRHNHSFVSKIVEIDALIHQTSSRPRSEGINHGLYVSGKSGKVRETALRESETAAFSAERCLEPLRSALEFAEALVKTQLCASFVEKARREQRLLDTVRRFIAHWIYFQVVRRRKEKVTRKAWRNGSVANSRSLSRFAPSQHFYSAK